MKNIQGVCCVIKRGNNGLRRYYYYQVYHNLRSETQANNLYNPSQKILFKLETISKSCGNYSTTNTIGRQATVERGASTQKFVRDYYQGGFINFARASPA